MAIFLTQSSFNLHGRRKSDDLSEKVAPLAASLIVRPLIRMRNTKRTRVVQEEAHATFTQLLVKEDGLIDFLWMLNLFHAKIRAYYPWPKAYTYIDGVKLILSDVSLPISHVGEELTGETKSGTVVSFDKKKGLKIACSDAFFVC